MSQGELLDLYSGDFEGDVTSGKCAAANYSHPSKNNLSGYESPDFR